MWDECNCVVIWTFFGTVFLCDRNENWPFPVLWLLLSFLNFWHIECSTFTASSFRIWNNSAGIPAPTLALFVAMIPEAHLTSHSRMSGSRQVTTPSWIPWLSKLFIHHPLLLSSSSTLQAKPPNQLLIWGHATFFPHCTHRHVWATWPTIPPASQHLPPVPELILKPLPHIDHYKAFLVSSVPWPHNGQSYFFCQPSPIFCA